MSKKLLSILICVMIIASVLAIPQVSVSAATPKFMTAATAWVGSGVVPLSDYISNFGNATITKYSSTNPKVLGMSDSYGTIMIHPNAVGTSTIKATVKVGSKSYTITKKFSVKKHPNPITKLTLNGESIYNKNKPSYIYNTTPTSDVAKIGLTLAKGWKLTKMEAVNPMMMTKDTVKLNTDIPVVKDEGIIISLYLKNTKGEGFKYMVMIMQ